MDELICRSIALKRAVLRRDTIMRAWQKKRIAELKRPTMGQKHLDALTTLQARALEFYRDEWKKAEHGLWFRWSDMLPTHKRRFAISERKSIRSSRHQ
jgi:hypothetical protein